MRFALDPEIVDFAASIDSLLVRSDVPSVIRAWSAGDTDPGTAVWSRVAETGVAALLVTEESGGAGASAVEAVVALEVLGRHAVPGPVVESVMVAPRIAAALRETTPDIAGELAGGALASVAVPGVSPFAPDAHVAAHLWVADDDAVFTGTAGDGRRSVDRARTVFTPQRGERVASASTVDLVNHGALGTAAQLMGLGQAMLDMSVDYAKQRSQYGKVIGQYQALKHQLAEVAIAIEMARPLLWAGALAVAGNPDDPHAAARDVSAARVAVADAAHLSARTALQIHGAIGYTLEHDLGLWLTKTRALQSAWGTQSYHRGRVLDSLERAR
ncbi:acyl-CoA dehydrogenase [Dietzia sp. PP-33]|jgi:alkylation response protein AidB-like acyl-CoA dehydrogenase|uniref:acyl-CoA dehydrogenase n=1 Tax=Dietzia sp. PP-33 TaxID=2957500 RepID=UPI0029B458EA|nr:acyl-CoA dehydrogenase [Dietzia sp. PP-33]MDX2356960.1 acyl-CoA dehydrogenase family protein [Dietzia sp. PP-33]